MADVGRPPWIPTEEDLAKIRLYAGVGSTQEHIATMIGKSVDTLHSNPATREAMRQGKAETIAKVAGTLVKKALSGDTASAIFYLKTQGRWTETYDHNIGVQDSLAQLLIEIDGRSKGLPKRLTHG